MVLASEFFKGVRIFCIPKSFKESPGGELRLCQSDLVQISQQLKAGFIPLFIQILRKCVSDSETRLLKQQADRGCYRAQSLG